MKIVRHNDPRNPLSQKMFLPAILASMLAHIKEMPVGASVSASTMMREFMTGVPQVAQMGTGHLWDDPSFVQRKAEQAIEQCCKEGLLEKSAEQYARVTVVEAVEN